MLEGSERLVYLWQEGMTGAYNLRVGDHLKHDNRI